MINYSPLSTTCTLTVGGTATFAGDVVVPEYIKHSGDLDTFIRFSTNQIRLYTANSVVLTLDSSQNATFAGYVAATQFRPTNIVTNKVVKFNGTQLDDSSITDTGSLVTFSTSLTGTNATFTAGTAASGTPLTLGSNTQTNYTLQQFKTSCTLNKQCLFDCLR